MTFGPEFLTELFACDRPGVRWRHDVDYDPECALRMAELEHRCGIQAAFHIRARGPYNPFSTELRIILHGIAALGHRLAVHTDLELPRAAATPAWLLSRAAYRDYRLLSGEYPIVRDVSFHAPPNDIYGKDVPRFRHVFSDPWQHRTVSDSRGVWHGDPLEALAGNQPVVISVHPEWSFWPPEKADEWRALEAAKP